MDPDLADVGRPRFLWADVDLQCFQVISSFGCVFAELSSTRGPTRLGYLSISALHTFLQGFMAAL